MYNFFINGPKNFALSDNFKSASNLTSLPWPFSMHFTLITLPFAGPSIISVSNSLSDVSLWSDFCTKDDLSKEVKIILS